MKKYNGLRILLLTFLLVCTFGMTAAAENDRKVVDMADLLTDEEEDKLQEQLAEISEKYQCDVVAATTDSCGGQSPQDFTDDFYYENGYGYGNDIDGIILMVSMEERKFHLATRGKAIQIFTDYGLEQIDDRITGYLSDAEYYDAFKKYGELAETFIKEYEKTGEGFDVNKLFKEKMSIGLRLLISVAAGLVAAVAVFFALRAQLKSVGVEKRAQEYVRDGSFHVTRSRDVFLYRTVHKERKPDPPKGGGGGSSTHRTSGGGSAGGRTGSF